MKIAMLSPVAWRTPPYHYGPWEQVVSWLTEGLVKSGADVTLFATQDSATTANLHAVIPHGYEEGNPQAKMAWSAMHIAELMERASEFDIIHNNFDFLPLTYARLIKTPMVTTIHGFSLPEVLAMYQRYSGVVPYVSISNSNRHPDLEYAATVYHGLDITLFPFEETPQDYLLFFGRICEEKGAKEAIAIAKRAGKRLVMAGMVSDKNYFKRFIEPEIDGKQVEYLGNIGSPEKQRILGRALALLHPISLEEPFGLSVIEAMACGTPVIAFRRGSMPEIINDGKTGFLVETVEEAVKAVLLAATLNRQDCRTAVEERFTSEQMVEGYLSVYQQILENHQRQVLD